MSYIHIKTKVAKNLIKQAEKQGWEINFHKKVVIVRNPLNGESVVVRGYDRDEKRLRSDFKRAGLKI